MAANLDVVLPGKIHQRVRLLEIEPVPRGMNVRPFHLALGNDDVAICDNGVAIGQVGRKRAGAHRGTVWN